MGFQLKTSINMWTIKHASFILFKQSPITCLVVIQAGNGIVSRIIWMTRLLFCSTWKREDSFQSKKTNQRWPFLLVKNDLAGSVQEISRYARTVTQRNGALVEKLPIKESTIFHLCWVKTRKIKNIKPLRIRKSRRIFRFRNISRKRNISLYKNLKFFRLNSYEIKHQFFYNFLFHFIKFKLIFKTMEIDLLF